MLVLEDNETENVVENEAVVPTEVVLEEKVVEQKEETVPVKKPRKPYTKKLVIGKETEIKDVENIEEAPQPKRAKKAKSKSVNFVIEE